jgi:uncharacterized protein HemY
MTLFDHKTPIDLTSIGLIAMTIIGALPHVAAALSVIWSVIRIYETPTFQKWWKGRKAKKAKKNVA